MQIRMCIHHALNKLQFANSNIRTVIAYSLEICKNIIQNKAQLNGAFAVLKPFDMRGAVIYFVGPTPAKPGQAIGSAGPTTSYRMDAYSPALLRQGLTGMIGKGKRDDAVKAAVVRNGAVYLAALGGAGALMAKSVQTLEVIAWPDLGCEAMRRAAAQVLCGAITLNTSEQELLQQVVSSV